MDYPMSRMYYLEALLHGRSIWRMLGASTANFHAKVGMYPEQEETRPRHVIGAVASLSSGTCGQN